MEDIGKLILRLTTAGLILFHGIAKIIHGVSFIGGALASHGLPAFIAYLVYAGEVIAPIFVIAGLWTRIASLVVMVNMVVAISLEAYRNTLVIRQTGAWGLEAEAFFLLTALVIFLLGPGKYSVMRESGTLA
ncbi:MAG TPA: DoxX family protein [Spirochaetia bacterium]|nr:DoxX family protein [Spirochaetia bacterium]